MTVSWRFSCFLPFLSAGGLPQALPLGQNSVSLRKTSFHSVEGLPQAFFYGHIPGQKIFFFFKNLFLQQKQFFLHLSCHPPNGFWQLLRNLQHGTLEPPPGTPRRLGCTNTVHMELPLFIWLSHIFQLRCVRTTQTSRSVFMSTCCNKNKIDATRFRNSTWV